MRSFAKYFCAAFLIIGINAGILYPKSSETREVLSLDGIWDFALGNKFDSEWFQHDFNKLRDMDALLMPVPSSYNDISVEKKVRDHMGLVWYQRKFFVPTSWMNKRVWLRFSSVLYSAEVWVNGRLAMAHQIGHLPFQADVRNFVQFGQENIVTVACDNILLPTTIPQGNTTIVDTDQGKRWIQTYDFDFFNYAGIHRPVTLYTTPKNYIDDITIVTESIGKDSAEISYEVEIVSEDKVYLGIKVFDQYGEFVISESKIKGTLTIEYPNLWWPYLMDSNPGYLYTLQIMLLDESGTIVDTYRQQFGIRKLVWNTSGFQINGRPIYMHGFGRHEDSDIRGRGLDLPTVIKDYNLIKWVGGNAYRTSHYPYADEIMDLADRLGIMIIDECPAVNIDHVSSRLQTNHMQSLTELIARDKNRPSVVAWSIANEPRSQKKETNAYFAAVANHTKKLDPTRPITASLNRQYFEDQLAEHLDIISFNRYNSWYENDGRLDMITNQVIHEATNWRNKFKKPIIMSEYGADTMEGLHLYPAFIWSEEYQVEVLSKHFRAFDELRSQGWFVGEFIWNFADFKTSQKFTRVGGNKKGIFTRNRQPKAAAYHLRRSFPGFPFSTLFKLHLLEGATRDSPKVSP